MNSISESDWKKLRSIKGEVLNFSCERVLDRIKKTIEKQSENKHEIYLDLWKILKEEDQKIAIMFDDLKRSNAIHKLAAWKHNGVISDDSFAEFSNETRHRILALNELFR